MKTELLSILAILLIGCERQKLEEAWTPNTPSKLIPREELHQRELDAESGDIKAMRDLTTFWLAYQDQDVSDIQKLENCLKYYKLILKHKGASDSDKARLPEAIKSIEECIREFEGEKEPPGIEERKTPLQSLLENMK